MMPRCFLCNEGMNSLKLLVLHFRIIHKLTDKSEFRCSEKNCTRSYLSLNSFKKHFKTHINKSDPESDLSNTEMVKISQPSFPSGNDKNVGSIRDSGKPSSNNNFVENLTKTVDFNELIKSQVTILITKLYGKMTLPRNLVQDIINDFESCFVLPLEEIKNKLNLFGFSDSKEKAVVLEMCSSLQNIFSEVSSEYLRFKFLDKSQKFVKPEEVIIGHHTDINLSNALETKDIKFEFIPLRHTLKCYFQMDNVLDLCLKYQQKLQLENKILSNIIQGSLWKSKKFSNGDLMFPLLIYFDEFEVGNPLGSHSGINKLGAVYASVPLIPPEYLSKLTSIFVCMLFHSMDIKTFGNAIVFSRLVDELNYLSTEGIIIEPNKTKLKFQLILLQGDNLGLHILLGFAQSFNSNFFCRFCKSHRDVCSKLTNINQVERRTKENYETDLSLNNVTLSGIKESCIFNKVENFHIMDNSYCDIMHDLLEGVCKYTFGLILHGLIEKKYVNFDIFNLKFKYFNYGVESKNRPPLITLDNIKNKQIRLSASEMLCLTRYFGIILGSVIPKNNIYWKLYQLLHEIVCICTSFDLDKEIVDYLEEKIIEHHKLFLRLNGNPRFPPKFHFLLHLPYTILQTGPPINLWTMRYESKHKELKSNANVVSSRTNICKTLAIKSQLKACELYISNKGLKYTMLTGKSENFPNVSNTTSIDEKVKILLMEKNFLNNIFRLSSVTYCGVKYQTGNVILVSVEDNYSPEFGIIKEIFLNDTQDIAFIFEKMQTIKFDKHLMSYKISTSSNIDLITSNCLPYRYTLLYTVVNDNEKYVSLRYSAIFKNNKVYRC